MSNTSNNNNNNKGIDIQTALSILNERSKHSNHEHHNTLSIPKDIINKSGQVIQLYNNNNNEEEHDDVDNKSNNNDSKVLPKTKTTTTKTEVDKKKLEEQKKNNEIELRTKFESMNIKDLLQTVLQIQSERVATYNKFQSGLDIVLKTNNMTSYPITCTNVTASFSLQSNTINMIKSTILKKHNKEQKQNKKTLLNYTKLIQTLQKHEKQKLDYTTAYHLECIRLNHMKKDDIDDVDDDDQEYKNIRDLLQKGVIDLKKKINNCVYEINDVLEEIRYGVMDDEE